VMGVRPRVGPRGWAGIARAAGVPLACAGWLLAGCAGGGGGGVQPVPKPPPEVMPDRVAIWDRGGADGDGDSYIDGAYIEVYLFDQRGEWSEDPQPFHRDGRLRFELFGEDRELLCEGVFSQEEMRQAERKGLLGPTYKLMVSFIARGMEDERPRTSGLLRVEFEPASNPEQTAVGVTSIRLGPI